MQQYQDILSILRLFFQIGVVCWGGGDLLDAIVLDLE
jgi:hypothetical protein